MNSNKLAIALGAAGLLAAWHFSRRQSAALAQLAASIPQQPVLPSRTIGSGYIDPIAPIVVDRVTGEVSAPYGTDILLDPSDPAWAYMGASVDGLPNVQPSGAVDDAFAD